MNPQSRSLIQVQIDDESEAEKRVDFEWVTKLRQEDHGSKIM